MAKVKCTRCGAEVEAQKFCIQCGERLIPKESTVRIQKTSHTPSGVMRFRHRNSLSQSSLPVVSNRQKNANNMNLASLQSVQAPASEPLKKESTESVRQSRELEALLLKLNGNESYDDQSRRSAVDNSSINDVSQPFESLEVSMSDEVNLSDEMSMSAEYGENVSFDNSFFFENKDETNVSGPIPVGSGSFARVPSGGFHLVFDSIKTACKNTVARIRHTFSNNQTTRENAGSDDNKRRNQFIAIAVIAAIITLVVILSVSGNDETQQNQIEVASQNVGGNENFAILPIEEEEQDITTLQFDADDFSIPELDFAFDEEADPEVEAFPEKNNINSEAIEMAKAEAKRAAEAAAGGKTANTATQKAPETVVATNKPSEARLYGRNDNVLATNSAGESYKTKRSCVMREGPASRFDLVKEVAAGTTIKILANTEEDWVLQAGGVWTKAGQPSKLGPGSQFADASKGMSLPQPKSRVISSNNWRYIQAGKVFGYVGPACFK